MGKYRYCLRYAAGAYWLLDIGQPTGAYKPPMQMNEAGAELIKMLNAGYERQSLIRKTCEEYGAEEEAVARDVDSFLQTLRAQGIEIPLQKGMVLL